MSFYRNQLEDWISKLEIEADTVFDIGGGEKPMTQRKIKKWAVNNYRILDNDPQFQSEYFDLNKPIVEDSYFGKAGAVLCFEVMEYVYDPMTAHTNIYSMLMRGGTAYISYPTIYPLHNPPGIDYLRYSKNVINFYLRHVGFRQITITPRIATNGLNDLAHFYAREGMHPMKGDSAVYDIGYMVEARKDFNG